jgi:oligopeptide/dipeptide ABC transporter ATP-binding protein
LQLTFLFITHDISVVKHISDQVAVIYLGQIVGLSPKADLFENPRHPYTKLLFSAVPDINRPSLSDEHQIKGEIPNPTDLPPGCYFAPRCPLQTEECLEGRQDMLDRGEAHFVRCFNVQ